MWVIVGIEICDELFTWIMFENIPRQYNISERVQSKLCTYNVTLRRVLAPIVTVEKQLVLHILSVCLWP